MYQPQCMKSELQNRILLDIRNTIAHDFIQ